MTNYLEKFKHWYNERNTRERIFSIFFSWSIMYAFFSLFFLNALDEEEKTLKDSIRDAQEQIKSWETQMTTLNHLLKSPTYQTWLKNHEQIVALKNQYQDLLKRNAHSQWQQVLKTVLKNSPELSLAQIKNSNTDVFSGIEKSLQTKISKEQLTLIGYSNYFDTISYLENLEHALPTVQWNSLAYEVMEYPVGKITMEFSIFYEKPQ